MPDDALVRARLRKIIAELHHVPAINASMLAEEYAKRHGYDDRVRSITASLLYLREVVSCR